MSIRNGLFSSESVSEGHPDKLADRISDAVLDEFLRHDPSARVACETLLADQCVVVAGEFKTRRPETFRAVRERAKRRGLRLFLRERIVVVGDRIAGHVFRERVARRGLRRSLCGALRGERIVVVGDRSARQVF